MERMDDFSDPLHSVFIEKPKSDARNDASDTIRLDLYPDLVILLLFSSDPSIAEHFPEVGVMVFYMNF